MEWKSMPAIIVTPNKALFFGRRFRFLSVFVKGMVPYIDDLLVEAGINISSTDYIAAGIFIALVLVAVLSGIAGLLALVAIHRGLLTFHLTEILILLVILVPIIYFIYFINYPKLQAARRQSKMDESVSFAIREIMIKVGSGVPIFNALLDVSNSNYGLVSDEFKVAIEEIQSGVPQEIALQNLAKRVPSQSLRRAVYIIINAVKSGSDVHETLVIINDILIKKQQSDMKTYAAELTPLSMAYMLISVVLPSLGLSVFLVLGSLGHLNALYILYIVPIFLLTFQVFFMGILSKRRPPAGI